MSAPAPQATPAADPAADPAGGAPSALQPVGSPSVRAVGEVLLGGRMTAMQIRLASGLPRRTVYSALTALRKQGLLQQRRSLQDSRQSYFWLIGAAQPPASNMPLAAMAAAESVDEPATSVP